MLLQGVMKKSVPSSTPRAPLNASNIPYCLL